MTDFQLNSVNTVTSPQQRPSLNTPKHDLLKRSFRQQYVHNRSQLLNLCNLILNNQDILVRQLATDILRELNGAEINDEVRRFLVVESKPPEIEYDAPTFSDIEYDDENIPLARTPKEEVKTPPMPSENAEERHRFIVNRMWTHSVHPEEEIRTIPKTTILGAMFNLQESTVINIFILMRRLAPIIMLVYVAFCIIFYLTIFGTIRPKYAWIVLAFYPIPIMQLLLANLFLVKKLLRNFETWFLLLQTLMFGIVFIDMIQGDARCICVLYIMFLQIGIITSDAVLSPSDERVVGLLIALSVTIINVATLYAGLWQYKSKTLSFGYISFTTEEILSQRILTLLFFTLKHIVSAYRHPDCFVILVSRLTMSHIVYKP